MDFTRRPFRREGKNPRFLNDKPSITADPTDANSAYAAWTRFGVNASGPALFTRTTDGGLTWESARIIHTPGPPHGVLRLSTNYQIVVLPDGALVANFSDVLFDNAAGERPIRPS